MGMEREYDRGWKANPEVDQYQYNQVFRSMVTMFRAADNSDVFDNKNSYNPDVWAENDNRAYEAERLAKEAQQAWVSEEEWTNTMDREEDDRGSE